MKMKRIVLSASAAAVIIFFSAGCSEKNSSYISKTDFYLWTTCTLALPEGTDEEYFNQGFAILEDIENKMSTTIPDSEVSAVNRAAGNSPVPVSEDVFTVIKEGLRISEISQGAFDISVGPLVNLWNIGKPEAAVPDPVQLLETLPLVDYEHVTLDEASREVFLTRQDMALDLGGIAKGFAADKLAGYFQAEGIQQGLIDLGGNISVLGRKSERRPWKVGIQNPEDERGGYLGILSAEDTSIVTSGIYERFFIEDGKQYHHILDTENGYPAENRLASVTLVCPVSLTADALSTALFVLGLEKGLVLAESLDEVDAVFVTKDRKIFITSGIKDDFSVTNDDFTLQENENPGA